MQFSPAPVQSTAADLCQGELPLGAEVDSLPVEADGLPGPQQLLHNLLGLAHAHHHPGHLQ